MNAVQRPKRRNCIYYLNKINSLRALFGTDTVLVDKKKVTISGKEYPVIDDVIVLIDPDYYTDKVRSYLDEDRKYGDDIQEKFSEKIQYTFGEEWKSYSDIKPEHEKEFNLYFDLIDVQSLGKSVVCDLGCGIGRWSYFLKDKCRELLLVDFSDAIFEARRNLKEANNCLFFMGDIKRLPFKHDFADLIYSLGVLHHLPTNCLDEVRELHKYAPQVLVYLYYSLDNRPFYFRIILLIITLARKILSSNRNNRFRKVVSSLITLLIYKPLITIGHIANIAKLGKYVPLYEAYHTHSLSRLEQDVYDRFFTSIEQRVSKRDVLALKDTYSEILVSEKIPYWHFLCRR